MKKKTIVKILLDMMMLAVIALMYSKQALGQSFHEIGGLALIGAFMIHKGLNFTWIRNVTARFFKIDGRTRLVWIVDALMLMSFLAVGVSGILISKVVFSGLATQGGSWKAIHYSGAALSLILVGVHMGLHMSFLKGVFSRWVRLPRVIAALLLVAVMAYGVYGMATSSFLRWLSMPFTASAAGGEGFRGGEGRPGDGGSFPVEGQTADNDSAAVVDQTDGSAADSLADGASAQTAADATSGSDAEAAAAAQTTDDSATGGLADGAAAQAAADSATGSDAEAATTAGSGDVRPGGPNHASSGSFTGALTTLAQFGSIAFLFAALTAFLDTLRKRMRRAQA